MTHISQTGQTSAVIYCLLISDRLSLSTKRLVFTYSVCTRILSYSVSWNANLIMEGLALLSLHQDKDISLSPLVLHLPLFLQMLCLSTTENSFGIISLLCLNPILRHIFLRKEEQIIFKNNCLHPDSIIH